jgi:hypothetical protein
MMNCDVRQELLRKYSEAAEKLAPLSRELTKVALSYEADLFVAIWERFKRAQEICENTRQALESHTASHGCLKV